MAVILWTAIIVACVLLQLHLYLDEITAPSVRLSALAVVRPPQHLMASSIPLMWSPSPPLKPLARAPPGAPTEPTERGTQVLGTSMHQGEHPGQMQLEQFAQPNRIVEQVTKFLAQPTAVAATARSDLRDHTCTAHDELEPLLPAAGQLKPTCHLLIATAILRGAQLLQQPTYCHGGSVAEHQRAQQRREAAVCHVAFVDWVSERVLKQQLKDLLVREDGATFIGCWQLLRLGAGLPFVTPAANVIALKVLLPLLFSHANASLWVDASRRLTLSKQVRTSGQVRTSTTDGEGGLEVAGGMATALVMFASHERMQHAEATTADWDTTLLLRHHWPASHALSCRWWTSWTQVSSLPLSKRSARHSADQALLCSMDGNRLNAHGWVDPSLVSAYAGSRDPRRIRWRGGL